MTGFKPRTSGIESGHSTDWATTTLRDMPFITYKLHNDPAYLEKREVSLKEN